MADEQQQPADVQDTTAPAPAFQRTRNHEQRHRRARLKGSPDYAVRLLVDCAGPCPEFDRQRAEGPDNPRDRVLPAGTEITDHECWILCLPEHGTGDIRAEPLDEATAERVRRELQRVDGVRADQARAAATATADNKSTSRRKRSGK